MEVTQKPRLHQDWIDSHAYGIVKALQKAGHTTYLVGGCVRDLLVGIHPKDFDIATAAHPPQVKRLIYMSFVIGRRFRLVLVKRDDQQYEVSTFRRSAGPEEFAEGEAPLGDNLFGTPEEDAIRRDFTINGLFYDPVAEQLIDYTEGLKDIELRLLRMIGDPATRIKEDSVRILRALRLTHKIGFTIEPSMRQAMLEMASELSHAVLPRRREELLKILRLDEPFRALAEAFDLGLLPNLSPTLHRIFSDAKSLDCFHHYLEQYEPLAGEGTDPLRLFARLVYAVARVIFGEPDHEVPSPDISANDEMTLFMRDELGMFKHEQAAVANVLEIQSQLLRVDEFRKRGERRQYGFLRNDHMNLALELARVDYWLNPEQLAFWTDLLAKFGEKLGHEREEHREKRKGSRRRRRPRRGGARDAAATGTENANADSTFEDEAEDDSSEMVSARSPTTSPNKVE